MQKFFKIKLDSGYLDCKNYTLRQYMALNFAKNSGDVEVMKKTYSEIIESCTGALNLPKHDAELVLINLHAESEHENTPEQNYTCECGHTHPVKINVKNAYIDFNNTALSDFYAFEKFKIEFEWPKLWADDDITSMIVKCMKAIYVKDERIGIDELDESELDDLYNAITEDDIKKIKAFLLAPRPVLPVVVKCPECGKTTVHVINGFKEFTEIL